LAAWNANYRIGFGRKPITPWCGRGPVEAPLILARRTVVLWRLRLIALVYLGIGYIPAATLDRAQERALLHFCCIVHFLFVPLHRKVQRFRLDRLLVERSRVAVQPALFLHFSLTSGTQGRAQRRRGYSGGIIRAVSGRNIRHLLAAASELLR